MPRKFSDIEIADIADEFLERLEHSLNSTKDTLDLDSLNRNDLGWTVESTHKKASIHFDIASSESESTFIVRSLVILPVDGLPGKIHRLLADTCDIYHLGMQYEPMEIPEHTKMFLQQDIGCTPAADGRFIRPPH